MNPKPLSFLSAITALLFVWSSLTATTAVSSGDSTVNAREQIAIIGNEFSTSGDDCDSIDSRAINTSVLDAAVDKYKNLNTSAAVIAIVKADPDAPSGIRTCVRQFGQLKPIRPSGEKGPPLMRIGSVTKVFTATLVAQAIADEKMSLDTPLSRYLTTDDGWDIPSFCGTTGECTELTLKHLLTHTSGLPKMPPTLHSRVTFMWSDMKHWLKMCAEGPRRGKCFQSAPGTTYAYSNVGFALAAMAVTAAYDFECWTEMVHTKLLEPLGMTDTGVGFVSDLTPPREEAYGTCDDSRGYLTEDLVDRVVVAYTEDGQENYKPLNDEPHWSPFVGAGGLFSTAQDMAKFMAYNVNADNDSSIKEILGLLHWPKFVDANKAGEGRVKPAMMGLGWNVQLNTLDVVTEAVSGQSGTLNQPWTPYVSYQKNGALSGFLAFVECVDSSQTAVTIMTNANERGLHTAAHEILECINSSEYSPKDSVCANRAK